MNRRAETKGIRRSLSDRPPPATSPVSAYLIAAGPSRRRHNQGAAAKTGTASNRNSSHGDSNARLVTVLLSVRRERPQ